jgi:hypothetical protein
MGISVFKTIRSPVAKAIYFILAAAFFIGFGILSSISPKNRMKSIKVDGKKVFQDEFFLMLKEVEGTKEGFESPEALQRQAFELMLARKSISSEVEKWGFSVKAEDIIGLIGNNAGIRTRRDYLNFLRQTGATESSFENYLKGSYFFSKFQDLIVRTETAGDFRDFQDFISNMAGIRAMKIAEIDRSKFRVSIDQKEIERYYIINRNEFKIGEKREFWIAKFPSESTAQSFFSKYSQAQFRTFEEFESKANEEGGKATSVILGKEVGTSNPAFAPFFSEKATEGSPIAPPINIGNEWWIVRINKIFPEKFAELKEVEGLIRERLIGKKVGDEVMKILEQNKGITSEEDFEKAFSKYSVQIKSDSYPVYLDIFPGLEYQPELGLAISDTKRENFVFEKPIEVKGKVFVVFIGKLFPSPEKATDFVYYDVERVIKGLIAKKMADLKIEPASRKEAIEILTGAR